VVRVRGRVVRVRGRVVRVRGRVVRVRGRVSAGTSAAGLMCGRSRSCGPSRKPPAQG
jgi:hypothetical protein